MLLRFVCLTLGLFMIAGCASRPQIELDIARSEVAKAYAIGAKALAPGEYEEASAALHEAEIYISHGKYRLAKETLTSTLLHATKATELAQMKAAKLEVERQVESKPKEVKVVKVKKPIKKKIVPPKPKPIPPKPKIVLLDKVTVIAGETLFSLANRKDVYADPLLWPLIYKANRDQIKDPQRIFKGQVFTIPRDKSGQEQAAARKEAKESDLFR